MPPYHTRHEGKVDGTRKAHSRALETADHLEVLAADTLHVLCPAGVNFAIDLLRVKGREVPLVLREA